MTLIGVLVCVSSKERSVDGVLFDFAMLSAMPVPCSENVTTLNKTMQMNETNKLWATSQEAIKNTALAPEIRRSSGRVSAMLHGTESKLALRDIYHEERKANEFLPGACRSSSSAMNALRESLDSRQARDEIEMRSDAAKINVSDRGTLVVHNSRVVHSLQSSSYFNDPGRLEL